MSEPERFEQDRGTPRLKNHQERMRRLLGLSILASLALLALVAAHGELHHPETPVVFEGRGHEGHLQGGFDQDESLRQGEMLDMTEGEYAAGGTIDEAPYQHVDPDAWRMRSDETEDAAHHAGSPPLHEDRRGGFNSAPPGGPGARKGCTAMPLEHGQMMPIMVPPEMLRPKKKRFSYKAEDVAGCWCLPAHPFWSVARWGSTRTLRIKGYDASLMRVFYSAGEEDRLHTQMEPQEEGMLSRLSAALGVISGACSPLSPRGECQIRSSPFTSSCVGVRGIQGTTTTHVYSRPLAATLVPMAAAAAVFLLAPALSHSLYCWYTGCAFLTSLLGIGIISFYLMHKFVNWKTSLIIGLVSWSGAAWQVFVKELLSSWWSFGFFSICALVGFLVAYNNPPTARKQFSLQIVMQFFSSAVILGSAPNALIEGAALLVAMVLSQLWTRRSRAGGKGMQQQHMPVVREEVVITGGVIGGEGRAHEVGGGGQGGGERAEQEVRSRIGGWKALGMGGGVGGRKRRLTEKHYIEQNYQGPLKAEVLRSNPFHCTGAAEYITEEEYQTQRMSYTQVQEAALLAYMRREGMKKFAHVLSPEGRMRMSDRITREFNSSDDDLSDEY